MAIRRKETLAGLERALRAVANGRRLQILEWVKDPRAHFPEQAEGDLVDHGVCGIFIADRLGISQPTVSEHLRVLADAGLLRGKRIKNWTFYKRDEARIDEMLLENGPKETAYAMGCSRGRFVVSRA